MGLTKYTTKTVPKAQQLAYWNEAICDAFTQLKCDPVIGHTSKCGFSGSIECCDIGGFQLSKVTSDASFVSRTQPHISKANSEVMLLHLQTFGSTKNSQDNKDVVLQPGDFTLCRNTLPYSLEIDRYHEMLVARIPVAKLSNYTNPHNIPTGFKFERNDPFSKLVGDHLLQIWKMRDINLPMQQIEVLSETTLSLIGSLLNIKTPSEALSTRQYGHLSVVKHYIVDNLHRSELNTFEIAHHAGVSTRYISKLFQLEQTSCSQYILGQRLKAAARRLKSQSYQNMKIIDVAFSSGFNSIEYFNRSFKQRYHRTPTQYRKESIV